MDNPEREVLGRLEGATARALERLRSLEQDLADSRRRTEELDRAMTEVTGGGVPASAMMDRLRALEAENGDLKRRLGGARERVERLLAKIRFLEEQR